MKFLRNLNISVQFFTKWLLKNNKRRIEPEYDGDARAGKDENRNLFKGCSILLFILFSLWKVNAYFMSFICRKKCLHSYFNVSQIFRIACSLMYVMLIYVISNPFLQSLTMGLVWFNFAINIFRIIESFFMLQYSKFLKFWSIPLKSTLNV